MTSVTISSTEMIYAHNLIHEHVNM